MFEWLHYDFMIRALTATMVLSFSVAPVGAFLVLRRLSLAGEAMAHAIVPGIVIAFVVAGLSVGSMIVGGLSAGITVAVLTSLLARMTIIREDASLASLYLIALALGIFILSAAGSAVSLGTTLAGSALASTCLASPDWPFVSPPRFSAPAPAAIGKANGFTGCSTGCFSRPRCRRTDTGCGEYNSGGLERTQGARCRVFGLWRTLRFSLSTFVVGGRQ